MFKLWAGNYAVHGRPQQVEWERGVESAAPVAVPKEGNSSRSRQKR